MIIISLSLALALAREQFFDSLEWQYSCVEGFWFVLEPYGGKNVEQQPVASRERRSLKPFGSRLDGWGKFIRQKTMAMMMMMMMTVCPSAAHTHTHTARPSFFFFHNSSAVPSVFFFCFSIWLRDKHYIRSHKLWVARRNDLTFFLFLFFKNWFFGAVWN
jgi:hypothetical protein